MAFVDWNKELETGVPFIDKDHKVLVDLLNQVNETMDDSEQHATLGSVLNSLVDYTDYHFAREERLQEAAGYAGLEAHRRNHQALAGQVRDIRDKYEKDPESIRGVELLEFLRTWLSDHIISEDMEYREAAFQNRDCWEAASSVRFDDPVDGEEELQMPRGIDWGGLSVLVVDDNKNFQVMLNTLLKSLGVIEIRFAGGAEEGLAAIAKKSPNLILCDWRMDGQNGIDFVKKLRADGLKAKVVMLTGYSTQEVHDQADAAGVDGFLEKPITARGFLETAVRVLSG